MGAERIRPPIFSATALSARIKPLIFQNDPRDLSRELFGLHPPDPQEPLYFDLLR